MGSVMPILTAQEQNAVAHWASGLDLAVLAEVFEQDGALDRLEAFASLNGPAFYGLPANEDRITLHRGTPVTYPTKIETDDGPVTVFDPGYLLHWHVE